MNSENIRDRLRYHIVSYRKQNGMTQADLAEKMNYSDKAVSKWERGESVPDVETLVQIADLFGVTVNDLLTDPDALPENPHGVERVMETVVKKTLKRKADKNIILCLTSVLTLFVALLAFVILSTLGIPHSWMAFVYALPADAIAHLCLRSAWHDFRRNQLLISVVMWGAILSLYLSLLLFAGLQIWKLFLLGVPGQAAIILWNRLFVRSPEDKKNG